MFKSMILVVALVAFMAAQAESAAQIDCSKVSQALDDLGGAQGLTVMNPKYKLWTTEEQLTARCKEMSDALKELKMYNSQCFTSLTKQVFSAIINTRSAANEDVCLAGSPNFNAAVAASKCIAEQATEEVLAAERKTILDAQLLLEANIPDEKMRLRRACCSVLASRTNFLDATKGKCAAHVPMYTKYVDSYTSEAMGLICPDEAKLDCGKLEPLKSNGQEPKALFFLNPMLKLVKTLDH